MLEIATLNINTQVSTLAPGFARTARTLATCCAAFTILLGCGVLIGWTAGSEILMSVIPGFARMKANAACGFIFSGFALWALLQVPKAPSSAARFWTIVPAGLALAIGAATLVEYLAGTNLGLDQIFFADRYARLFPGRMAAISCVCFCLGGASTILQLGSRRARQCGSACALLLATLAFAAIVGYAYGVTVFYGSVRNSAMAIHTGIGFLVLSIGLVAAQPSLGLAKEFTSSEKGGWIAWRVLPLAVLLPVALGWLYLKPAMNFGQVRFAIALFAVTLTVTSTLSLWLLALFLNRAERQQNELNYLQRTRAEAVAQSEQELRVLTNRLPILLSYLDREGRFTRVNQTYERWIGIGSSEIVGRTIGDVLGDDYLERSEDARRRALGGQETTLETSYPTVRGEREVMITYSPDSDEQGYVRGLVCMVQDIEDQRKAESALRQNEKLAAVGRLTATIAHEINNPLESVTNLLYLARRSADIVEVQEFLSTAERELQRVSAISQQTLRFYKQSTKPRAVLCEELFDSVLTMHQGRIVNAGVLIVKKKRATTPVLCFENEIRQVLNNLVGNAIDAMHETGGRLLLRSREGTHWSSGRRGVYLCVADTGSGMSDSVVKKVFEAFYTTKGQSGTGLGLWVSAEIVERHKGVLNVRSSQRPGRRGTTFSFFLPFDAVQR